MHPPLLWLYSIFRLKDLEREVLVVSDRLKVIGAIAAIIAVSRCRLSSGRGLGSSCLTSRCGSLCTIVNLLIGAEGNFFSSKLIRRALIAIFVLLMCAGLTGPALAAVKRKSV